MIIEISVAIIALAFAFLVVYLIILIKTLKGTLNQVNFFLFDARKQLDEIGAEAKKAAEVANQITGDLKYKLHSLNPFFQTAENIGNALEAKVGKVSQSNPTASTLHCYTRLGKEQCKEEVHANEKTPAFITDIFQIIGLGLNLWQNLKKRS